MHIMHSIKINNDFLCLVAFAVIPDDEFCDHHDPLDLDDPSRFTHTSNTAGSSVSFSLSCSNATMCHGTASDGIHSRYRWQHGQKGQSDFNVNGALKDEKVPYIQHVTQWLTCKGCCIVCWLLLFVAYYMYYTN